MPAPIPIEEGIAAPCAPQPLTIRADASLAGVERAWRQAEGALAGYVFQTFDWLRSTQETLGAAAGVGPCIATVSDPSGRVVLLLPLGIVRRRGVRELVFLGDVVTDYNAPLIDAAFARSLDDAALGRLWQRLLDALPPHDLIRLERMPATLDGVDGRPVANPLVRLPGARLAGVAESIVLPGSYDEFQRSLRTRFVADTRRCYRRLAEQGPVSLDLVEDPARRRQVVGQLLRLKSRRWVETGSRDWSLVPAFRAFYDTMSGRRPGDGQIHVSVMRVGDSLVAAHWGAVWRHRFYYLLLGWEAGPWKRYGTGRLIVDELLRRAIAEGVQVFDCTVGNESYKHNWVNASLPLYALAAPATPRGRVVLGVEASLALVRARAKRMRWLRRLVRRARGLPPFQEPPA